jgi:hypothetical protein
VLEAVVLPYCTVLLPEPIDIGRGRRFAGYHARHGYHPLIGQGVLDEFGTLSSPIWLTPAELLGKMYDFGIAFGFRRDPELPLDGGWPPVCIGLSGPAPALPPDWERELTAAIEDVRPTASEPAVGSSGRLDRRSIGTHRLDRFRLGEVSVIETDAPLLPHQLRRLCAASSSAFTLAVAAGQRIDRSRDSEPARLTVASEATLAALASAVEAAA